MELELEYKFKTDRDLEQEILALGFISGKTKHQEDTYFISDEIVAGLRTWLRIRNDRTTGRKSFDLHQKTSDIGAEEIEVLLSSEEDIAKIKKIVTIFGLEVKCIVNKNRRTFNKDNVEIVLDDIEGLGSFIEIEIIGEENEENVAKICALSRKLGFETRNAIKYGYPDLLMDPGKVTKTS